MAKYILFLSIVLTGCAQPPRLLAEIYNSNDPCQLRNNGGNYPSFCGASGNRITVYNNRDKAIGYVKQPSK